MPDTQRQEPKEKEEQITISGKFPVSFAQQLEGFFGGSSEEAIPSPDFSPPGQNGNMFEGVSQEDFEAASSAIGPPPPGVQTPRFKQAAVQNQPPPGQPGGIIPSATQEEPAEEVPTRLPTRIEAYAEAKKPLPPVTTREEFGKTAKVPSWWRRMLYDFSVGVPGASQGEVDRRIEKAYQEHIEPQTRARAEKQRQAEVEEKFAVGEQFNVASLMGFPEGETLMMDIDKLGQLTPLILRKVEEQINLKNSINLREMLQDPFP